MGFFKQIGIEFKNILRVKFLLIFGIIILALSAVAPILGVIAKNNNNNGGYNPPVVYAASSYAYKGIYPGGGSDQQPITVDGVTILPDNPYYWNIQSLQQQQTSFDASMFTTPGAMDLALNLIDAQIQYFVHVATYITNYQDYRVDLTWDTQSLVDKFIYENTGTADPAALKEAAFMFMYLEDDAYNKKFVNITAEERLAALDVIDAKFATLFDVIENDNFPQYIDLRIQQENDQIKSMEDQIEILEQDIIENPDQEENLSMQIEDINKQIQLIKDNNIPILQYRLEHNIVPMTDVWQNKALDDMTSKRQQLQYTTIMTEEQFNQDQYTAIQYGSYASYVAAIQAQIDKLNNDVIIAQNCLDADKPDMKYVQDGARNITVQFLAFSLAVALFGIMVGGWLMASEFQMGTIRLLMIRPKTRLKILMSKFIAGLLLCIVVYAAGTVLNILINGICFGFADFGFPNFTVTGEVGFFGYYIPKFLACIVPIIFVYCVSYMLSVLVKNIAVAIAVPAVCLVGCLVVMFGMYLFSFNYSMMSFIAFTPIPFVQMYSFFVDNSPVAMMMQNGVPVSLTYGIIMLLVLAAVCTGISMLVFKKKDITN
jgi:ABC-2 type transport system permease protein